MALIDLTAELRHGMLIYPAKHLPGCEIVQSASHATHARSVQKVTFGTHISTHIDAPLHALPDGASIDQIPIESFIGDCTKLTLSGFSRTNPITEAVLRQHEAVLKSAPRTIFHTGWAELSWGTMAYFSEGPYLTRGAARYLATLNLKLIGMDFPNIDSFDETRVGTPNANHVIVLSAGTVLLENLLRLGEITVDRFRLTALPLNLIGGDGCPARAVAEF